MVSPLSRFTAALICLSMFRLLLAVPLAEKLRSLSPVARDVLKRTTPAAPRFVVYQDQWTSTPPPATAIDGFTVYTLAFWMTYGPADMALTWTEIPSSQRTSILDEYNAAGISIIVSAFGSTDAPTSAGDDAVTTANTLGTWVKNWGLQGVDVDYEDFNAFNSTLAVNWLISFTQALRSQLPQSQYILSHAPVAPWFSTGTWIGGGYLAVHEAVGSLIDWYNVQFYNQGAQEYTTCSGLLFTSSPKWPESAVFQIANNGVDPNKIVIGKPATAADANNGYIDPSTLATCINQAKSQGWSAGVMTWEYPRADSAWIKTVRGNTWPVLALPPLTPTTSTAPSATATAPYGTGTCAGVQAWAATTIYVGGNKAIYNGDLWTAKWWTQGNTPGDSSGDWTDNGPCT